MVLPFQDFHGPVSHSLTNVYIDLHGTNASEKARTVLVLSSHSFSSIQNAQGTNYYIF